MKISENHSRIPISTTLEEISGKTQRIWQITEDKKRILFISFLAVIIGACISFIGKVLVLLINFFTNISFHHRLSFEFANPAISDMGIFVVFIPAIGGLIVGLMALYGSRAIRGHGIPEAMEQILTNDSKIRPSITYLKPLSSAISIGTGGPFGSEGPIIATGGALGSTLGQLLRISAVERKILLASGATAGMSAIFGSPIAAIFLAIELLLFEFSPRSIIPVALACITGSAGHHLLFETGPVFPAPHVEVPGNVALAAYSCIGLVIGLISAGVTKVVYFVEDSFEKLPIHWMWWPAIGGLVVGIVGYFFPRTMGVGYVNITDILSGSLPMKVIFALCLMKFISWAIALGSGTSGGTLAPLLTIGGATGALLGVACISLFPHSGVTLTLAALVGMSAMFAGSSRALLTSIIFAIETTGQSNALLPLLAACLASYVVSFFLLKNTIMTEKIARRGVKAPNAFEPDILDKITIGQVMNMRGTIISSDTTVEEATKWLQDKPLEQHQFYIVTSSKGEFEGVLNVARLYRPHTNPAATVGQLVSKKTIALTKQDSLKSAVEIMADEKVDQLPVVDDEGDKVVGILSYRDVLSAYRRRGDENNESVAISLKRRALKMVVHGKRRFVE
jgi:H+/Cl- antiporter ClcA